MNRQWGIELETHFGIYCGTRGKNKIRKREFYGYPGFGKADKNANDGQRDNGVQRKKAPLHSQLMREMR